jgi:hypothetical protein
VSTTYWNVMSSTFKPSPGAEMTTRCGNRPHGFSPELEKQGSAALLLGIAAIGLSSARNSRMPVEREVAKSTAYATRLIVR